MTDFFISYFIWNSLQNDLSVLTHNTCFYQTAKIAYLKASTVSHKKFPSFKSVTSSFVVLKTTEKLLTLTRVKWRRFRTCRGCRTSWTRWRTWRRGRERGCTSSRDTSAWILQQLRFSLEHLPIKKFNLKIERFEFLNSSTLFWYVSRCGSKTYFIWASFDCCKISNFQSLFCVQV